MNAKSEFHILLVEDNPGDVELTRQHLMDAKIAHRMTHMDTGSAALAYLQAALADNSPDLPDLILLDINLPGINGIEVLERIKLHADLRRIPVVILTSSDADTDVLASYQRHANAYIKKPVDLTQFGNIVEAIDEFWLTVVKLPNSSPQA